MEGRRRRRGRLAADYVGGILSSSSSSSSEDADERSIPPAGKGDGEDGPVVPMGGMARMAPSLASPSRPRAPLHPGGAVRLPGLGLRWIDW